MCECVYLRQHGESQIHIRNETYVKYEEEKISDSFLSKSVSDTDNSAATFLITLLASLLVVVNQGRAQSFVLALLI